MFSPHGHFNEVPLPVVQRRLRSCFRKWGLPRSLQVDNGKPFGDPQRSSVPELALWLIGLGVKVLWTRISTPKDNASVERMQRTTACWTEPHACPSFEQMQTRLDAAGRVQREKYALRRKGGKTRRQLYRGLWRNPRTYSSCSFDIKRVYAYLEKLVFVRRVSKSGSFTFYAQSIYVGTRFKNQNLTIAFNRRKCNWTIAVPGKGQLGSLAADNFSKTAVRQVNVCRYRSLHIVKLPDAKQ